MFMTCLNLKFMQKKIDNGEGVLAGYFFLFFCFVFFFVSFSLSFYTCCYEFFCSSDFYIVNILREG